MRRCLPSAVVVGTAIVTAITIGGSIILGMYHGPEPVCPPAPTRARIVVIGDSHMYYLPWSHISPEIENYAACGCTTERAQRIKIPMENVRLIVLGIGANDLAWYGERAALQSYDALLATLPAGVPVICILPLPIREETYAKASPIWAQVRNAQVLAFGDKIKAICAPYHNVTVFDGRADVSGPDGQLRADLLQDDGVHLADKAYGPWIPRLAALIRRPQ